MFFNIIGSLTVVGLISWAVYSRMKDKAKISELESDYERINNVLTIEQKNRAIEKAAYEERLSIKQSTIEAMRSYILSVGGDHALDIINGLHQDDHS